MTSGAKKRFEAKKIRFLKRNAEFAQVAFDSKEWSLAAEAATSVLVIRCYRNKIYSLKTVAVDIERSLMNTWKRMKGASNGQG